MTLPAPTPAKTYSRSDLEQLRSFDRADIFRALRSFEDAGLSDDEFVLKAAVLLDGSKTPGLSDATKAKDPQAILDATMDACRGTVVAGKSNLAPVSTEAAEDVLQHRFTFYDETHQLPVDIDWDFNPGTAHWGMDLNRFSYLRPLLAAWYTTDEVRFARKGVDLILDWIAKCDFGRGFTATPYVFGSYLNNAIHCEVWGQFIRQVLPAGIVEPVELMRILKSLHDQLAYLEIVTNGHAGNWPTIGCRGILAALAALPVLRDREQFAHYCIRTLSEQIADQVLPDGVQDELTPHYHWCVVNNLLVSLRSARELGRDLAPRTLETLHRMVHYTQQTIMPDGSAQLAFNDSDCASVPSVESLLEQAGLEDSLPSPARGPELFPYAGVAFLRQRPEEGDLYLAFDGGPYGRGHQHEDKLGFWLFAYGRSFLVDPGRHLYDRSAASYYNYLRSTRAHSTILINGDGQHSRGRPDTWIPREPCPMEWEVGEDEIRASAFYDLGYGKHNAIEFVHRREIVFVRNRFWVVFDSVEGEGEHEVDLRFQFAPCELEVTGSKARTCFEDSNLLLWSLSREGFQNIRIDEGEENPRGGWYSSRYGLIEPAPCLSLSTNAALPFFSTTLLFPFKGETEPEVSLSLEAGEVAVTSEECPARISSRFLGK
ncbi:MAG: alginate lyase family protein [Planctomycetota bacterium]|jgi:uncharacterized heparinase superfamily protein|nr:alginate lyase family protein [Planctomycetota bacterium]MDP7252433.1 alginate lyase family protein [Planctomycetota bacterium]